MGTVLKWSVYGFLVHPSVRPTDQLREGPKGGELREDTLWTKQGLLVWLFRIGLLEGDIDVEVDVDIDSYFSC